MGLLFEDESYAILGAAFEVYKELGCGFLEAVYQEALERELKERNIPFVAQPKLQILFKGQVLKKFYEPDLVVNEKIIVELKVSRVLDDSHRSQAHNYLKATGLRLALLINFASHPKIQHERIVR